MSLLFFRNLSKVTQSLSPQYPDLLTCVALRLDSSLDDVEPKQVVCSVQKEGNKQPDVSSSVHFSHFFPGDLGYFDICVKNRIVFCFGCSHRTDTKRQRCKDFWFQTDLYV